MAKSKVNESSIYFKEYGNGEPLLLIAGLASDSQSWLGVVNSLAKHFRVIIFDNRGVGRSPQNNDGITIQKMTDDCIELLNQLNISKINILGHSMGGMIAMDLAIRYPEKVNKLILEATSPKINMRNIELFNDWVGYLDFGMDNNLWFKNIFYWIFSPAFFNNKAILNEAINMSVNNPYPQSNKSFNNQVKAVTTFNCLNEIESIKAPTLVMFGELDMLFPKYTTNIYYNKIPDIQTITVPNAAHSIHIDNPKYFVNSIIDYVCS